MDGGVIEVHAPDGRVWWVKRAWVPRYLSLRDRLARFFEGRDPHWYDAPLRWFAQARRRDVVDWVPDIPDPTAFVDLPTGDLQVPTSELPGGDFAAGATTGWDFVPNATTGGDFAPDATSGGDTATDAGGDAPDVGFDGDEIVLVILVVLAVVGAVLLAWFVVVPLLLVLVDGVVLLLVVALAGLVRLLFRRPWDVVAAHDRADGALLVRRWEVRGFRRAGRVRDDVARALGTGTDADLAVTRVLVREPRGDDPPGSARSVREPR